MVLPVMAHPTGLFSKFFASSPAEQKGGAKKGGLLSNAVSSAIGGLVHACVEQPVATPVEASITQAPA